MHWQQMAGWLAAALLAPLPCSQPPVSATRSDSSPQSESPASAGRGTGSAASHRPLAGIHRAAILLPESPTDPVVLEAVAAEQAVRSRRRRITLFRPKPADGHAKPMLIGGPKKAKRPTAKPPPSAKTPERYTPVRLREIAQQLFFDALVSRAGGVLGLQIAPQSETSAALAEVQAGSVASLGPAGVRALCGRLKCDALLIPSVKRVRVRESDERALSIWVELRILRPEEPEGSAGGKISAAGGAVSERAPFQDHFAKEWPQVAGEAAREAAAVTVHTLATGLAAPLVGELDRVAVAPVIAPSQADALVFHPGGRTVAPGSAQRLDRDVAGYFHPYLVPLFPDSTVSHTESSAALATMGLKPEALWVGAEEADTSAVSALGKRLKVQFVLVARISDIELALTSLPASSGSKATQAPSPSTTAESGTVNAPDTATAEAIGVLIRVSDGAALWSGRARTTWGAIRRRGGTEEDRRHTAQTAERFALAELERRFRAYRRTFE